MTPTRNPNHYHDGRYAHRASNGRFAPRPAPVADIAQFVTTSEVLDFDGDPEWDGYVLRTHHASMTCCEIVLGDDVAVSVSGRAAARREGIMCPTCVDEGTVADIAANMAPAHGSHYCTGCGVAHVETHFPTLTMDGYRFRGRACRASVKGGAQQSPHMTMITNDGRFYSGRDPMTPPQTVTSLLSEESQRMAKHLTVAESAEAREAQHARIAAYMATCAHGWAADRVA